jgi:MFS family permease
MVAALCGGRLCDRFGRRWTMILPRVVLMLAVYPAFQMLLSVKTPTVLVAVTVLLTLIGGLSGTAALTALTEALPNESRSSGMAVAYASAVTVFGGTAQFIIAWLIDVTGDRAAPAYYIIGTSAISVWAMFNLSTPMTATSGREAAMV